MTHDAESKPDGEPLRAADIMGVMDELQKSGDKEPCGSFSRPHLLRADGVCQVCEKRPEAGFYQEIDGG